MLAPIKKPIIVKALLFPGLVNFALDIAVILNSLLLTLPAKSPTRDCLSHHFNRIHCKLPFKIRTVNYCHQSRQMAVSEKNPHKIKSEKERQ